MGEVMDVKAKDDGQFPDLSGKSDAEIIEWMLAIADRQRLVGTPPLWLAADMVFRFEGLTRQVAKLKAERQDARNELSAAETLGNLKGAPIGILAAWHGQALIAVGGKLKEEKSEVGKLEHSLSDAMEQIAGIQGTNEVHMARVAELETVLRTLHGLVDEAMGDSDLDGDPLTVAMGDAWRVLKPDQRGEGKS